MNSVDASPVPKVEQRQQAALATVSPKAQQARVKVSFSPN
jgi:hypothetical protein